MLLLLIFCRFADIICLRLRFMPLLLLLRHFRCCHAAMLLPLRCLILMPLLSAMLLYAIRFRY